MIVRSDLPSGMKVAQAVHAAGESSDRVPPHTYAVALEAGDLSLLSSQLEARGIPHARIIENDAPYTGQLLAIGIEPTRDRHKLREVLGKLKLAH